MEERIFVAWLLNQLPHTTQLGPLAAVPGHSPAHWESFERALSGTLSVVATVFPPYLVQLRISDGRRNWTIATDGVRWTTTRSRAKSGRPVSDIAFRRQIHELYASVLPQAQELKRRLKEVYKTLNPADRRRPSVREAAAHRYLRSQSTPPVARLAQRSVGEPCMLAWEGATPTDIFWDDFIIGQFQPRTLVLSLVAWHFKRAPGTIRNILQPSYRTRRIRARK